MGTAIVFLGGDLCVTFLLIIVILAEVNYTSNQLLFVIQILS